MWPVGLSLVILDLVVLSLVGFKLGLLDLSQFHSFVLMQGHRNTCHDCFKLSGPVLSFNEET